MKELNEKTIFDDCLYLYRKQDFSSCIEQINKCQKHTKHPVRFLNLKGAAEYQLGKFGSALDTFSETLKIDGASFDAWNNSGLCAEKLGKLTYAVDCYTRACSILPSREEPFKAALGIYTKIQNFEGGRKLIKSKKTLYSNNARLCEISGTFFYENKKFRYAKKFFSQCLRINDKDTSFLNNLALVHLALGENDNAITLLKRLLSFDPNHIAGLLNLGLLYKKLRFYDKALIELKKAKILEPEHIKTLLAIASTYLLSGNYSKAYSEYKFCYHLGVTTPQLFFDMGNCNFFQGEYAVAVEYYQKCISDDPLHRDAHFNLGVCLTHLGDFKNSQYHYEQVIEIDERYAEAYRHLVANKLFNVTPEFISLVNNLISECKNEEDEISYCWTLHISYEKVKDYKQSIKWLQRGSKLRAKRINHSSDNDQAVFDFIENNVGKYASASSFNNDTIVETIPIFIVGMPRSGTTLLEQVLSAHDDIVSGGELRCAETAFHKMNNKMISSVVDQVKFFRESYLSLIPSNLKGNAYFIDKMPQNFMFIPLLRAAFPESKIIHIFRSPEATCWSNYKQYFESKMGINFSHNIEYTTKYYNNYVRLMQIWEAKCRDKFINLDYERLTVDPEQQIRKLFSILDISWQDSVLMHHLNKSSVTTASQYQVRQPIYKQSSQAWKNYEEWLGPTFKTLTPFPSTFPRV